MHSSRSGSGAAAIAAWVCALLLACAPAMFGQNASGSSGQSGGQAGASSGAGDASSAKKPAPTPDPKPCSVIPDPDPCSAAPKPPASSGSSGAGAPSAVDRFPFPGSASADSSSAPTPSIGGAPDGPELPSATPQAPSVAPGDGAHSPSDTEKKFPFPGAAAAGPASSAAPMAPDAAGSSSSSSSSSNDGDAGALPDDGAAGLKDAGSEGTTSRPGGHILHRAAPATSKPQTADEREAEDLDVAKFYMDSGDLQGAYLRTQDAVKTSPDDPDAHFALAEVALKLGKKDEAAAEYSAVLKLDPSGKEKKDSTKALARLK